MLDEPVVARAGDRFVLRGETPLVTVGGGVVDDPLPLGRRARPWARTAVSAGERLQRHLADAGTRGVAVASLAVRLGARPDEADAIARGDASLGTRRIADRVYAEDAAPSHAERAAGAGR